LKIAVDEINELFYGVTSSGRNQKSKFVRKKNRELERNMKRNGLQNGDRSLEMVLRNKSPPLELDEIKNLFRELVNGNTQHSINIQRNILRTIVSEIMDSIDFTYHWRVEYRYAKTYLWRNLTIDNAIQLSNQLKTEGYAAEGLDWSMKINENDYDFFPCSIAKLSANKFMKKVDSKFEVLRGAKSNTLRQGAFWKWSCTLPINLERYMIFNELQDRTVKILQNDNCIIYACKMLVKPEDLIEQMKTLIKCRYIP
jgi:hypothetical protein